MHTHARTHMHARIHTHTHTHLRLCSPSGSTDAVAALIPATNQTMASPGGRAWLLTLLWQQLFVFRKVTSEAIQKRWCHPAFFANQVRVDHVQDETSLPPIRHLADYLVHLATSHVEYALPLSGRGTVFSDYI